MLTARNKFCKAAQHCCSFRAECSSMEKYCHCKSIKESYVSLDVQEIKGTIKIDSFSFSINGTIEQIDRWKESGIGT